MAEETGAWVSCPRCPARIGLGRFADDDDEPGVSAAVCGSCGERVLMIAPPDLA